MLDWIRVYFNRRMAFVLMLNFSSTLPFALASSTLQAWYTTAHVSVVEVGMLSLVGFPALAKWLWAPLFDRFSLNFLDRRRGWMLLSQVMLALTLCVMSTLSPQHTPVLLALCAVCLSFFMTIQDITINAYQVDILTADERGMGAACSSTAGRFALILSGGVAIAMAAYLGWHKVYLLFALGMLLMTIITYFAPSVPTVSSMPMAINKVVKEAMSNFWVKPGAVAMLFLIVFYKFGDAFTISLTTFFFIKLGFSLVQIGVLYKTVMMVSALLGGFIGGALLPRLGLYRGLLYFGLLQAFANLSYLLLAVVGKNTVLAVGVMFLDYCSSGVGTVAFVALLMGMCDRRFSATQYACFSAIAMIGRVVIGPVSGVLVAHLGWVWFYLITFACSFPGVVLVKRLKQRIEAID